MIATYPTVVGYVESWYTFPGQSWRSLVNSPLNASYPVEISSFGVGLGTTSSPGSGLPEVIDNTCTWTGYLYT